MLFDCSDVNRINRIRLEFKGNRKIKGSCPGACINRIRLEFKALMAAEQLDRNACINRIRLEFKVVSVNIQFCSAVVLIESDWNLKQVARRQHSNPLWY